MNTPSRTLYICKVCEDGGRCWSSFYSEDEIYLHLQANTPRATHATPLICASDHAFLSRSSIDFNKGRLIRSEQVGEVGMGALESAAEPDNQDGHVDEVLGRGYYDDHGIGAEAYGEAVIARILQMRCNGHTVLGEVRGEGA